MNPDWYSYKKTSPLLWYEIGYFQHRQQWKSDNSISSIYTFIFPATTSIVSERNSTSPYHRLENTGRFLHILAGERPYIAHNPETYITIRQKELKTCKRKCYEFYCEELTVVKYKLKYSCESAIYFNMDSEIIKENCKFAFYYNKRDVTPTVLDGGNKIMLANWPNDKHIICSINNDIPVRIHSHPYVLVNRSVMCYCGIEGENNFLLESLAACHASNSKLVMHFMLNMTIQIPGLDRQSDWEPWGSNSEE